MARRRAALTPAVAGWLLAFAVLPFIASLFLDVSSPSAARALRALALLMMVPGAMTLGLVLARRGHATLVTAATACGVASLLLWAAAGTLLPWSVEPLYIALSAAWWLGLGFAWPARRPGLRWFTIVVGVFAFLDVVVTLLYDLIPFWVFAVFGGPKIPLSLVWTAWAGIALARGRTGA